MRKRLKKLVAAMLAAALTVTSVPAGAAVNSKTAGQQEETAVPVPQDLQEEDHAAAGWDGKTTEDTYEGENFRVTFTLSAHWEGGYNADIEIRNTGDTIIENWMLEIPYAGKITNIWNAVTSGQTADGCVIKNAGWNQDIEPGKSVSFGISGQENFPGFPQEYRLRGSLEHVQEENYAVSYRVDSEWDSGFTGEIEIKNSTDAVLEDWVLEFDFGRTVTDIWNGVIESHEGNHYVIKNAGYNSSIPASGSVSFGFNGQDGKKGDEPSGYKLYSYTDSAGEEDTDKDSTDEDSKETVLTIKTDGFTCNENAGWYIVDKKTDSLAGTVSEPEKVKELSCEVTDIKGNKVLSRSIDKKENWKLEDFGLSIGYNKVTVTALLDSGKKVTEKAELMNYESSNLDGTDADMSDSDSDGLCNYYEDILGTDKNKADTDGDGLSDYDEFLKTGTDPVLKDTDSNGTADDKEDTDKDGLNNMAEIKQGTNCFQEDTDGDGLKDGEEVIVYHTNPLLADTDMDGLNDREDMELGFDPAKPDTDGNGILDGKEKVMQTCTQKIESDEKEGITEVSVKLACDGYIDSRVSIMDTYDLDMRSSDVVGLVGVPVEISTDVKFRTADITFTYDESALGDSKEDDLCMMWYDEENDNYVLLEDSVLDKKNNTITYKTTHFSTYLVVDKQIWLDNMRMPINYSDTDEIKNYDIFLFSGPSDSAEANDRIKMTMYSLIDATTENDRIGYFWGVFGESSYCFPTNDKSALKKSLDDSIRDVRRSIPQMPLYIGLEGLHLMEGSREKLLVLISDGDENMGDKAWKSDIAMAKKYGIPIYCINVGDKSAELMERIADETGGIYYNAVTSADVGEIISGMQEGGTGSINMTDSDGDGLYDVYETKGMRLSNGQIKRTDPHKADTDGDGINDYDEVGGKPVVESFMVGGNVYSCTLFHSKVYGKQPKQFIYVDGTLNSDGKQYFGKMDYVPYSNQFLKQKYENETIPFNMFDMNRKAKGAARVHGLFEDQMNKIGFVQRAFYAEFNTTIAAAISLLSECDRAALDCFIAFISGKGGESEAWEPGFTRKNIDAGIWIFQPVCNSANQYYCSNMKKAVKAAESILNKYNTEVYMSVSPEKKMNGGIYFDTCDLNFGTIPSVVFNLAAYGTFNDTDAGVTLHCVYNPETEEYTMDYKYYLIDYYDFTFLKELNEQDMLGLASGYELYGYLNDTCTWKPGEEKTLFKP